ncbi:phospholipase C [Dyadobacter sp. BE34]|uniref:phospholipase C n=1 Tax=Dyadobacter fermentans TaxID=94254 RepID=A0ABU1QTE9_9BACT|nr:MULTISPECIES: phospholipase C, phosphocholine-specific [Dyadobacter]MDR6804433.1 phospholipase C [Dyadobacter fermentans]MDR7042173.1 phospholipase C [Dyadobacter sp. BE242]MDR7196575.1 phospholipase C [Dyadobacter sp. BE34]MDR7212879.1 phospholipase C [Dyadobacter sp. BE31]MDR7261982.1 phospholipase C [Dyadobacter sp. BE32]
MDSRRDFLKKAALLAGTGAMANTLPPVIQKALAIDPAPGSTFYDAEHIVFLMQENRSFDHQLGMLQGVRGFNDPRAIDLADKNKVWFQTNKAGETYGPFRLNVKDTKVAWMGSIPHGWTDQTDAMNNGKYDRWLDVKAPRNKQYAHIPLTMGYCDRSDFPFYYSLADAFTVCDHNFCSSITGTHPNRYYWMTGTVREKNEPAGLAHLWNISNYEYPELEWKTYPERLEENGINWKVYQNELTMGYGLKGEESAWLSNFGTNVLEYFKTYNVRFHEGGIANLESKRQTVVQTIADLEKQAATDSRAATRLAAAKRLLKNIETAQTKFNKDTYARLSDKDKKLNDKAFSTNIKDPNFHELTSMQYSDNGTERTLNVPKGDVFHQFREDVKNGTLPTVSWLMPPAHFSDHPGEPWFGPWYVSEAMEILLQNPEVWKKTIFIVTYDENDGYFDHLPPFTVPNPYKEGTGKVSAGIDPKMDFALADQQTNPSADPASIREGSIGLGYRVPMIIASPWSRGGYVNSEVFDHTSSLQFLENFLEKKFNKKVHEENITKWRRTICGDLTSVFRPYNGEKIEKPVFLEQKPFIESIHQAQFKHAPENFKKLGAAELAELNKGPKTSALFPVQEKGVRPACALPYEPFVNAQLSKSGDALQLSFEAGNQHFGSKASGIPYRVYAMKTYRNETLRSWDYSVAAGDKLTDDWQLADFENNAYHLRIYGPNGFYREFMGNTANPKLKVSCEYEVKASKPTGNVVVMIENLDSKPHHVIIEDNSYKTGVKNKTFAVGGKASLVLDLDKSFHWYDFSVKVQGYDDYEERFAGHVETGAVTKTDPLMGGMV